jgi:hypothetical protein
MERSAIPEIDLPFPVRQHVDAVRIEAHTCAWAAQFQLVGSDDAAQGLKQSGVAEFGAYVNPSAPLPEAELVADWHVWLCFADDEYEEGAYGTEQGWNNITAAVQGVFETGDPAGTMLDAPLIRALTDLSRRLDLRVTPVWKMRFVGHVLDTMAGALREIQHRENGVPLLYSEYVALRRDAGAVVPCLDLIEVCAKVELAPEVYHSATYQEIVLAATDVISWTNDLYSVAKEEACGIVTNLVLVLQHERGLDQDQASSAVRALINDRVGDLLAAERRLLEPTSAIRFDRAAQDALRRCTASVRDWVAGSNYWHANGAGRFQARPDDDSMRPSSKIYSLPTSADECKSRGYDNP